MIDFDTTRLPFTLTEWAAFIAAIDNAAPEDESDWIEFKANLDLHARTERPVLAKAIVAFANREVARAAPHLGGHAVITVGLEPGTVIDVRIDPADLANYLEPYLGDPAPPWSPHYVDYKGKRVLVVIVDAPQAGDPIYCIAKAGGDQKNGVRAGDIYVRHHGKSELQTPGDLQMLTERMRSQLGPTLDLNVCPVVDDGVPVVDFPATWLDTWISAERRRLMKPLLPEPKSTPDRFSTLGRLDSLSTMSRMSNYLSGLDMTNPFETKHDEDRTEEEYKAEVAQYLERCKSALAPVIDDLRKAVARPVAFKAQNLTDENFHQLEVHLHLEGDVEVFDESPYFKGLHKYVPVEAAPRMWGPWVENKLVPNIPDMGYARHEIPAGAFSQAGAFPQASRRPYPRIVNGGSADITFPPVDLRPHSESMLDTGLLVVAGDDLDADVTCTWSATATNIKGRTTGSFTIPLSPLPIDLGAYLEYGSQLKVS
ncbi:AlbA family DNA-binding domain-containing protein [Nocardioides sp. YJ-D4]